MKKLSIIIVLAGILVTSCADLEVSKKSYPYIITEEVSDINQSGATFNASVTGTNKNDVIDYGFVWDDTIASPVLTCSRKSLGQSVSDGKISCKIEGGLKNGVEYHVRAYIKTSKYFVYGNVLTFNSKGSNPPVISGFSPSNGGISKTIVISGSHFDNKKTKNRVKLGSLIVAVDSATENTIYVKVPSIQVYDSVKISVEVAGMTATSSSYFTLLFPWTQRNKPSMMMADNTVSFAVQNNAYLIKPNSASLYVYNSATDLLTATPNLPEAPGNHPIAFSANNAGYLLINNDLWKLDTSTMTWSAQKAYPGTVSDYMFSFTIDNKAYVGNFHSAKDVWQYNPLTNSWNQVADFAGGFYFSDLPWGYFSFATGKSGYLGIDRSGGSVKQFWQYTPTTNLWTRKTDFTPDGHSDFCSFVINDKAYVGMGYIENGYAGAVSNNIWQYDETNDKWIKGISAPKTTAVYTSFVINDKAYILGWNAYFYTDYANFLYQFDPTKQ